MGTSVDVFQFLNSSVKSVPSSGIRKFFDLTSSVEGVISLGIGEPDFVTPEPVIQAAIRSLERGATHYTSNQGLYELRLEVAKKIKRSYGVDYRPEDQILITVGSAQAIDVALRAVISPGDEVIIPEPCYVSYGPCVRLCGGREVYVRCEAEHGFKPMADRLLEAISPRTKAILLNYPNNPTGSTLTRSDLEAIAEICLEKDLLVISDEVYADITYDVPHTSIASIPGMWDRVIHIAGLSKAYAMTGWRIGYAAGPTEIIAAMVKIHQYAVMCAPTVSQLAGIEALKTCEPYVQEMVRIYRQRRDLIVDGLNSLGLKTLLPAGAFYTFSYIGHTGMSSEEFAHRLLEEARVAVVPGNAFGPSGEGFIRCSYATSEEMIREALRRIERFMENNRR